MNGLKPSKRLGLYLVAAGVLLGAAQPGVAAQGPPQDPLVTEGIALHDKGEYDKAIEKYKEALSLDPKNTGALYEMMYSYFAKHDYKEALRLSEEGAKEKGRLRPAFFMMMGNAQDQLGNPAAAIKAYEAGLKESPNDSLLHFNLGVTLYGQEEWKKARKSLERDVMLNPAHSGGHLRLAMTYLQEGFKAPAFLAFFRFLILEPTGPRAKVASDAIDQLLGAGNTRDSQGNMRITLNLPSDDQKKEVGDFGGAEMMLAMARIVVDAVDEQGNKKSLPQPAATIRMLSSTAGMVAEVSKPEGKAFAAAYYLPYFTALKKDDALLEAACYRAWRSQNLAGVDDWLDSHKETVARLLSWSQDFPWPQPKS